MAQQKGDLKKVMTSLYNMRKEAVSKSRPKAREKRRRKWNDVVEGYEYNKALSKSESARGASWRLHDPENPVKKTQNPKKQANAGKQANINFRSRSGHNGVRVNKKRSQSSSLTTGPVPRLNNTETSAASAKAKADSWKVTPKEERKTQHLTPNIQAGGGGYFPEKAKTWKEAVRRYDALNRVESNEKTRRQSSLVGVDSPKAKLEQKAAGLDPAQTSAPLQYAYYKAKQDEQKKEKVNAVKKQVKEKKKKLKVARDAKRKHKKK